MKRTPGPSGQRPKSSEFGAFAFSALALGSAILLGPGVPRLCAEVPPPPAAQDAMQKGLEATGISDWMQADDYFEQARKAAPYEPATLYDLALAEARIPGRELRAAAWFGAYLAAAPEAANAQAVTARINSLETTATGEATRLLKASANLAAHMPVPKGDRAYCPALWNFAGLELKLDDGVGALATGEQIAALPGIDPGSAALANLDAGAIARDLAAHGYFAEAMQLAGKLHDPSDAYSGICQEMARQGRLDEAGEALSKAGASSQDSRFSAACAMAQAEYRGGSPAKARSELILAAGLARALGDNDAFTRSQELSTVADVYIDAGDWREAKALLPSLQNFQAFMFQDNMSAALEKKIRGVIADQLAQGNLGAAEELVPEDLTPRAQAADYAWLAQRFVIQVQPKLESDLAAKAEALLAQAPPATDRPFIDEKIAQVDLERGDWKKAARWRTQAVSDTKAVLQDLTDANEAVFQPFLMELGALQVSAGRLRDEGTLRAIETAAGALAPKGTGDFHDSLEKVGAKAAFSLAFYSRKTADLDALAADLKKSAALNDLAASFVTAFCAAGDLTSARRLDPAGTNLDIPLCLRAQFAAALRQGNLAKAESLLPQLSFDDDNPKDQTQDNLAVAQAEAGDFEGAQKTAEAIDPNSDYAYPAARAAAVAAGEAGDADYQISDWQTVLSGSGLAQDKDASDRYDWESTLATEAPQPGLARDLVAPLLADSAVDEDPADRVSELAYAAQAAEMTGDSITLQRATNEALTATRSIADFPEEIDGQFLPLDAAQCLEQGPGLWHRTSLITTHKWSENFIELGIIKLVAAGRMPVARALLARVTPGADCDRAVAAVAGALARQGDLAGAEKLRSKLSNQALDSYPFGAITKAIIEGSLKAGAIAGAEKYAGQNWPGDSDAGIDIITAMAKAGDFDWARDQLSRIDAAFRSDAELRIALAEIGRGQFAFARYAFTGFSDDETGDAQRVQLVRAAAVSGRIDLAQNWAAQIRHAGDNGLDAIIAAMVAANDVDGARALANRVRCNDLRTAAFRALAAAQVKSGDVAGARATLTTALQEDKRLQQGDPGANIDGYAAHLVAAGLALAHDFPAAQAAAAAIDDLYWRDRALGDIATSAAAVDPEATLTALKAIVRPVAGKSRADSGVQPSVRDATEDPDFWRAHTTLLVVDLALGQGHVADAERYAATITDQGFRALSLDHLIRYGIDHGNIAGLLPAVRSLPDGAATAYLLADVLRGRYFLGIDPGASNLLADARKAADAMPGDYWRARLQTDLAHYATRTNPALSVALSDESFATAQDLKGDQAALWTRYAKSLHTPVNPAAAQALTDPQLLVRHQAVDKWTALLGDASALGAPLFRNAADELNRVNDQSASSRDQTFALFKALQDEVRLIVDAKARIEALRAQERQAGGAATRHS